jgi:hypothetical protein
MTLLASAGAKFSTPKVKTTFAPMGAPTGFAVSAIDKSAVPGGRIRDALAIRQEVLAKGNFLTAITASTLGEALTAEKKFAEAEPLLLPAYDDLKSSQGATHPRTVEALNRIIVLYEAWHRPDDAAKYRAMVSK